MVGKHCLLAAGTQSAGSPAVAADSSRVWAAACVHREDAADWPHLPARDWKAASDLSYVALGVARVSGCAGPTCRIFGAVF